MPATTYRFATTAAAQRALRSAWRSHQARLASGADFFESRSAYYAEYDAITLDAIDPAGRDVTLPTPPVPPATGASRQEGV